MQNVAKHGARVRMPFALESPWYVLVELGTREGDRVLEGVRRAALTANVAMVGLLLVVCTFMGLATLTVPGRFSSLMEPATLMELKQSYEASAPRPAR